MVKSLGNIVIFLLLMLLPLPLRAASDTTMVAGDSLRHQLSLLHISDVHGSDNGLKAIVNDIMPESDDVVAINTGDLTSYRAINNFEPIIKWMIDWNTAHYDRPFLLLKGNHDTHDTWLGTNEVACNEAMLMPVNDGFVDWGPVKAGYWSKDFEHNGVKLRIIALDEYQHSVAVPQWEPGDGDSPEYSKVYSNEQMEWLVKMLKSTPSDYYIIMCHHQPPYAEHPVDVINDFVHHGINGAQVDATHFYTNTMYTYREGNIDLPARVVDAYLHRRAETFEDWPNSVRGAELRFKADFSDCEPATFAAHLCGHVHGDYCEYHPDFPEQLCLTVGASSPTISSWYDDLVRSTEPTNPASYLLNRVTIDADSKVVRVERLGASQLNTALTWIVQDGSSRTSIEFAIPKVKTDDEDEGDDDEEQNVVGDVDGDGMVNSSDLNSLINLLLGSIDASVLKGQPDVDGDGIVDIIDLNAIINIILAPTQANE